MNRPHRPCGNTPPDTLDLLVRRQLAAALEKHTRYQDCADQDQYITDLIDDLPASELLEHISDAILTLLSHRH
jgi:hypothetical protein